MRNALILLVVVAVLIVTLGAVNHSVALEIDYVAGTWRAVSLAWIGLAVAGVVVAAGLAAALLARAAAARARRKLESELDETYRRLRDAEARAVPRQPVTVVAATEAAAPAASVGRTAVTQVAPAAPGVDEPSPGQ